MSVKVNSQQEIACLYEICVLSDGSIIYSTYTAVYAVKGIVHAKMSLITHP